MKHALERSWLLWGLGVGSPLLLGMVSCDGESGGLTLPDAGKGGAGAMGGSMHGGNGGVGNPEDTGGGGQDDMLAGSGGTAAAAGGSGAKGGSSSKGGSTSSGGSTSKGGSTSSGGSGADVGAADAGGETGSNAGAGDVFGGGGEGGSFDVTPTKACLFHSPPSVSGGGEGGASNDVAVVTNAFVGPYLTDSAGLTLYIYGADVPGDCNTPPVSNCVDDCLQSWPLFDAGERMLDPTLDDAAFGTIDRGNGIFQTTYYGWPLYRYKSDTTANAINGQGKSKTWFAAEVELPNLMIMRGPVSGGGIKYLSDDHGRTLYALSGDTLGTSSAEPVSACTGTCVDAFTPFAPGAVYPVTSIEPHDVALFFRADGTLQTAYKGAPLYYAKADLKAGQENGLTLFGGALVLP